MKEFNCQIKDAMGKTVFEIPVFAKGRKSAYKVLSREATRFNVPVSHDYEFIINLIPKSK